MNKWTSLILSIAFGILLCLDGVSAQEDPDITGELTWFNQKTGKAESWAGLPPEEKFPEYLPQIPAAQGLYRVHLALGKTPLEAMKLVLQATVGEK